MNRLWSAQGAPMQSVPRAGGDEPLSVGRACCLAHTKSALGEVGGQDRQPAGRYRQARRSRAGRNISTGRSRSSSRSSTLRRSCARCSRRSTAVGPELGADCKNVEGDHARGRTGPLDLLSTIDWPPLCGGPRYGIRRGWKMGRPPSCAAPIEQFFSARQSAPAAKVYVASLFGSRFTRLRLPPLQAQPQQGRARRRG